MVERNRRNNLTANFAVTKPVQRSVLRFVVEIYIQLKMPFFVEVRGLKKNYDLAGMGIGPKQGSGLRDWGKILFGMAGLKNPIGDPLYTTPLIWAPCY